MEMQCARERPVRLVLIIAAATPSLDRAITEASSSIRFSIITLAVSPRLYVGKGYGTNRAVF